MLYYSIAMQRLTGEVNGETFGVLAASGGGRGRTRGEPESSLPSWDHARKTRRAAGVRGGPLPPGFYVVHKPAIHPRLGRSAYLEQTLSSLLQSDPTAHVGLAVTDRGGFFIHGQGRRGSDGCIVPFERFHELMNALEKAAPVGLLVRQPGMQWRDAAHDGTRTA